MSTAPLRFGIERLIDEPELRRPLQGRRVALLAHPASVTRDLTHSLDALTHRLGITIPEADRHTAIGDTVATADAFLKLMPMLQGRGLTLFGDVLTEVRKHGRLLKDLN